MIEIDLDLESEQIEASFKRTERYSTTVSEMKLDKKRLPNALFYWSFEKIVSRAVP